MPLDIENADHPVANNAGAPPPPPPAPAPPPPPGGDQAVPVVAPEVLAQYRTQKAALVNAGDVEGLKAFDKANRNARLADIQEPIVAERTMLQAAGDPVALQAFVDQHYIAWQAQSKQAQQAKAKKEALETEKRDAVQNFEADRDTLTANLADLQSKINKFTQDRDSKAAKNQPGFAPLIAKIEAEIERINGLNPVITAEITEKTAAHTAIINAVDNQITQIDTEIANHDAETDRLKAIRDAANPPNEQANQVIAKPEMKYNVLRRKDILGEAEWENLRRFVSMDTEFTEYGSTVKDPIVEKRLNILQNIGRDPHVPIKGVMSEREIMAIAYGALSRVGNTFYNQDISIYANLVYDNAMLFPATYYLNEVYKTSEPLRTQAIERGWLVDENTDITEAALEQHLQAVVDGIYVGQDIAAGAAGRAPGRRPPVGAAGGGQAQNNAAGNGGAAAAVHNNAPLRTNNNGQAGQQPNANPPAQRPQPAPRMTMAQVEAMREQRDAVAAANHAAHARANAQALGQRPGNANRHANHNGNANAAANANAALQNMNAILLGAQNDLQRLERERDAAQAEARQAVQRQQDLAAQLATQAARAARPVAAAAPQTPALVFSNMRTRGTRPALDAAVNTYAAQHGGKKPSIAQLKAELRTAALNPAEQRVISQLGLSKR